MSRFSKSKSFTSLGSRSSLPPASPSWPSTPSKVGSSTASDGASVSLPSGVLATRNSSLTITSIHAQWKLGLMHYYNFQLHAALSTFKRLLRTLRIPTEETSSPITDGSTFPIPIRYQTLSTVEIALLYINIALIHAYLGSYYLAAQAFDEALVLDEASGIAWFGLGIAKFYLRELRASKAAFGKCIACFVAQNMNGSRYQKNELIYKVWAGELEPVDRPGTVKDTDGSEDFAFNRHPFNGIMSSRLADGQWKLELTRVEWNLRMAIIERNWVRKGAKKPGEWGLNGIPAGVIFGIDSGISHVSNAEIPQAGNDMQHKDDRFLSVTDTTPVNHLKSTRGSLVKRKWTGIQQKLLHREPSTTRGSRLFRSAASSKSIPSPTSSIEQTLFAFNKDPALSTPTQTAFPRSPGLNDGSLPSSSHSTAQTVDCPYNDDFSDDYSRLASDHHSVHPNEASPTPTFPVRHSSLSVPTSRPTRPSRALRLSINTVIHDKDKIGEEYYGGENENIQQARCETPNSDEISPHDTSHGIRHISRIPSFERTTQSIFTQDFIAIPSNRHHQYSRSKSKPDTPEKATSGAASAAAATTEYGHDSFMTDAISSLGSGMQSAFFPQISWSRRPSVATDVCSIEVIYDDEEDEEQDHQYNNINKPGALLTLITPATPELHHHHRSECDIENLDDNPCAYRYDDNSPLPPLTQQLCDDDEKDNDDGYARNAMTSVVPEKRKISVTGRTCLGEWEWEDEYARWREEGELEFDGQVQVQRGDDGGDDDDGGGEMLRAVCFEGMGDGRRRRRL
ncbi:MAG: hypothetical protein Q9171_000181 [Xanthocarpia ochracea]